MISPICVLLAQWELLCFLLFLEMNRKIFRHNFVEQIPLTEETNDKGRVYITPTGERLRSVTTVLGDKLDKTWLIEWKRRVGEREAARISKAAMARGTALHGICERYVANEEDYLQGAMQRDKLMFHSIKTVLDEHVDDVLGIEVPLYSLALKTAGRTDLVAKYDGVYSVIDYKTSKRVKTESQILSYFLQSTVYSMMFERIYKVPIYQIVIIIAVDNEPKAQVFTKARGLYIRKVLDLFAGDT